MLTKNQIAALIEEETGIKPNLSKRVIDELGLIAADEIGAGQDFAIPGLVRISWRFTPARKKGEAYKKGETVKGPQGERVAEEDSPARQTRFKLALSPLGEVNKIRPKTTADAQKEFRATKLAKAVAKRKAR